MGDRKSCKSDLSEERWALIEPVTTEWKAKRPSVSGHRGNYRMREIVNALLYRFRTGGTSARSALEDVDPLDHGWRPIDPKRGCFEPPAVEPAPWPKDRTVLYRWRQSDTGFRRRSS
ncbi:hypothetical protein Slala03_81520 [Streptomyces lavendulae subsp. lavendulae]|uniref:transposase n=1 Tax=Streptomyces lavendulae TaxID=1914 RepID=UPI0024A5D80D|nr:transposase [Streptomyces lavendulae]GLV88463.1 hypothetical protein Slala03_81520 [Streptomyces lavendulae subsp. lavendulae]